MASSKSVYDVIVIGAGIEGSASAYNLSKEGKKVLLLEQFPLPHARGSSHGQSRITRYAYEDEFYVRMMVDAFPLWAKLEQESSSKFFINCGVLDLRTENSAGMKRVQNALTTHNIPHETLSSEELQKRYPSVRGGDTCVAIVDPSGGILRADRALRAFQQVFQQLGGVIQDNEPVTSVTPGSAVTVKTGRGEYTAQNVVIATGAWAGRLCSSLGLQLPLKPIRIGVYYCKASEDKFGSHKFPCFIDSRGVTEGFLVYGLPMSEYPGLVKICSYSGPDINPDERDKETDDSWVDKAVPKIAASLLPGLDGTPSIKEYCIYTNTPDSHPIIDRHPLYPNIVIAAGFSGHGFKLSPTVGKAVAELVLKKDLTYNMQPFKVDRFSSSQ
ncbi:hypothetical protein BsWGS_08415 [Bradybaena similaris]